MSQTYIGTKVVIAEPMTRQQYNDYRGWTLPADENGDDEGYLVEYSDGGKANMPDRKGYVSWSPKDVFERAYQRNSDRKMSFGAAIDAMKQGHRVSRTPWGSYQSVWMEKGICDMSAHAGIRGRVCGVPLLYFERGTEGIVTRLPRIDMNTNEAANLSGWTPSQADMLAEDWGIVE